MGIALFKIKILPESQSIDLTSLGENVKKTVEQLGASSTALEEQPIAFGLNALIIGFRINENIDSSKIEEAISKITGVSSIQIIDYRRAIN